MMRDFNLIKEALDYGAECAQNIQLMLREKYPTLGLFNKDDPHNPMHKLTRARAALAEPVRLAKWMQSLLDDPVIPEKLNPVFKQDIEDWFASGMPPPKLASNSCPVGFVYIAPDRANAIGTTTAVLELPPGRWDLFTYEPDSSELASENAALKISEALARAEYGVALERIQQLESMVQSLQINANLAIRYSLGVAHDEVLRTKKVGAKECARAILKVKPESIKNILNPIDGLTPTNEGLREF